MVAVFWKINIKYYLTVLSTTVYTSTCNEYFGNFVKVYFVFMHVLIYFYKENKFKYRLKERFWKLSMHLSSCQETAACGDIINLMCILIHLIQLLLLKIDVGTQKMAYTLDEISWYRVKQTDVHRHENGSTGWRKKRTDLKKNSNFFNFIFF